MIETLLLGALVTGLVQWLKNKYATSKVGTLFIVALLSFAGAFIAYTLQHFDLWETTLKIVATATTIYAFIIQHFEADTAE